MKNSDLWLPATVQAITALTPTVSEFRLQPDDGVPGYTPGAHINIQVFANGKPEKRSYSLVGQSLPDADSLTIAVKHMPDGRGGSSHMHGLGVGARVLINEPNNHFELHHGNAQVLLLAGGIGITPLVGMAEKLAAKGADVQMVYGSRSRDELAYAGRLAAVLGERLHTVVAEEGQHLDLPRIFAALEARAQVYLCGPAGMIDAARHAWAAAGRPVANLRFETFGNSGQFPNQAFKVRIPRHNLELEVPQHSSLLDALVAAGVPQVSDCRRGECGLCAMQVLSVECGELDHRDVFFSPHEKSQNQRVCVCVSRMAGPNALLVLDSAYRPDTPPA